MGFCYPGKAASAITVPVQNALPAGMKCLMRTCLISRLLCWWDSMRKLIILALAVKPRSARHQSLEEFLPRGYLPLPHPSPRNQPWLCRNPWFEEQFVLEAQNIIRTMNL